MLGLVCCVAGIAYVVLRGLPGYQRVEIVRKSALMAFAVYGMASLLYAAFDSTPPKSTLFAVALLYSIKLRSEFKVRQVHS